MSVFKLENAVAAKQERDNLIGHLVWYSVSECLIDRTTLRSYLKRVGLDEGYMPMEIRPSDAFRKATKLLEQKLAPTADPNIRCNYLVREMPVTKDEIERRLVVETVDSENRRLDYNPKAATFILEKKTWAFSYYAATYELEKVCRQVASDFEIFKTHHDSRAIRSMIYSMLANMAPINVRPSGGVYFIPIQYRLELEKMVSFVRLLGGQSEAWMMPVIDQREMRDMVRQKLVDHLRAQIKLMASVIKEHRSNSEAAAALEQGKRAIQDFVQYQQALDEELEDIQELTSLLKRQMQALLEQLAAQSN